MLIRELSSGVYGANCFIVASQETKDAIIIDPSDNTKGLIGIINDENLNVKYIVLTHGHGDHIGGIVELKEATNSEILIHEDDKEMLEDKELNLSSQMPMVTVEISPDALLKDGDLIKFGNLEAKVIHTKGHTKGCISIKIGDNIFTGDTLFKGSIGRTDLYGGSYDDIIASIKDKLMIYEDHITVYPGHGPSSTIGYERNNNPFLR
ncbi:MAG: MBL fold metallo-hydrolase [Senegalia sp. (in: firmicutes)]